jgi:hypothetical protein
MAVRVPRFLGDEVMDLGRSRFLSSLMFKDSVVRDAVKGPADKPCARPLRRDVLPCPRLSRNACPCPCLSQRMITQQLLPGVLSPSAPGSMLFKCCSHGSISVSRDTLVFFDPSGPSTRATGHSPPPACEKSSSEDDNPPGRVC